MIITVLSKSLIQVDLQVHLLCKEILYDAELQHTDMYADSETEQSNGGSCPPSDIPSSLGKRAELLVRQLSKSLFLQLRWSSTSMNDYKGMEMQYQVHKLGSHPTTPWPCQLCWSTQVQKGTGGRDVLSLLLFHE